MLEVPWIAVEHAAGDVGEGRRPRSTRGRPPLGQGRRPLRQPRERRVDAGPVELRVLERAGEVGVVGGQVEVPVAREVEEDDALLPRLRAASASSIATRIACADSGAGMIPSVRANCSAASNVGFWRTARASTSPA
jgi:hypothetical protein